MNLSEFVREFTQRTLFSEKEVVCLGNNYFLVSVQLQNRLSAMFSPLCSKPRSLFSIGVYAGGSRGREFIPSFQLLDMVSPHTSKKVVLNDKSSWLFVCGRDVFREGVLQSPARISDRGLVIVENEKGECLGLGRWQAGKKVQVTRILDRGDFLRRERKR